MTKKIKKTLIHDKWNARARVGVKVKCNDPEHYAFKMDDTHKVEKFHCTQIVTEPFVQFPKNIKTKTVYRLMEYGDEYVNEFASINDAIKYLRRLHKNDTFNLKEFVSDYSIVPVIRFVVE